MKFIIWIFAVLWLFAACKKEDHPAPGCGVSLQPPDSTGYFIFGTYVGMCQGPAGCAVFYKLSNGSVYRDSVIHLLRPASFSKIPLGGNSWATASAVLDCFPSEMATHPNTTIGCPDCHDQGGYYIAYKANSASPEQTWTVDTDTASLSNPVIQYVTRLDTALAHL